MHKKYLFLLLIISVMFAGCTAATTPTGTNAGKVYPYSFDTAKIDMTMTGSTEGTRTIYIKGDKIANEIHATQKNGDQPNKMDIRILELGEDYIQIDLNAKTAIKTKNTLYDEMEKIPADFRADYLIKQATGNQASGGTMPVKKEQKVVAGQTCDLYPMQTFGEVCLWNGIAIYTTIKIPDQNIENTTTADKIEINPDIQDSVFAVPADVKVQDAAQN
jgi:outer membrane lipoprotein-sorting protein